MVIPWAHYASYLLMLVVALIASVTDLRRGVIPNTLLRKALFAVVALAALVAFSTSTWWPLSAGLPAGVGLGKAALAVAGNALFGLVVSVLLYVFGLWAAGDAKLAIVLALSQPAWIGISGPVPWAPFAVVLGNTFVAAAVVVIVEVAYRRAPAALLALRHAIAERRLPFSAAGLAGAARMSLVMAALIAALSPIRQLSGAWAAAHFSGGYFFALLVLVIAYKPLRRLVSTRAGLVAIAVIFMSSATFMIARDGPSGAIELGRSLLFCLSIMVVLGLLGGATRPLDARAVSPEALEERMVLTEDFLDELEVERRWQEAFAPIIGSLRGVRLDDNLIENLREWQAHNAPDSDFMVKAHIPFAPAFAIGVALTAVFGRLMFTLGSS